MTSMKWSDKLRKLKLRGDHIPEHESSAMCVGKQAGSVMAHMTVPTEGHIVWQFGGERGARRSEPKQTCAFAHKTQLHAGKTRCDSVPTISYSGKQNLSESCVLKGAHKAFMKARDTTRVVSI